MKIKTILIILIALCCADSFAQLRRPGGLRRGGLRAQESSENEVSRSKEPRFLIPGVDGPLIPFEEKDKIKYEDAVERAKKNDAEAFYWLAYYFLKGEGVEKNSIAAGKFLQKAVDAGSAKACYLVGLYHEWYSLEDEHGHSQWSSILWQENERNLIGSILGEAGIRDEINSLQLPNKNTNDSQVHMRPSLRPLNGPRLLNIPRPLNRRSTICCTNDIAAAFVTNLYLTAAKGGLTYATNDTARLKRAIAKCHERIVSTIEANEKARAKGAAALDLLVDASERETAAAKQKKDEERKQQYEKSEKEREYWSSWPRALSDEEMALLDSDFEKQFNCVFLEEESPRPLTGENRSASTHSRTNTWVQGKGKSLIVFLDNFFYKIASNGQVVACGLSENSSDLEECRWYEEEIAKRLALLRSKWAKERDMSLEEAMQKYKVWQEQKRRLLRPQPARILNLNNRPGLNAPTPNKSPERRLDGLELARARREAQLTKERREAEEKRQEAEQMQKAREEREKAAEKRKAQLEQLKQLREELRRQREETLRKQNNMK